MFSVRVFFVKYERKNTTRGEYAVRCLLDSSAGYQDPVVDAPAKDDDIIECHSIVYS